jgi:hypothetical protein
MIRDRQLRSADSRQNHNQMLASRHRLPLLEQINPP